MTSESGETTVYTVAVTRETKPVTAVAGKTGTSSAAKGKDAASSEKLAESEVAEANVEEAPAETTVVTGEARDADLTRTEAEKNARAVQTRPSCYGCHRAACGGIWLYARRFVAACFRKEGRKVRSAPRRMMHTLRSDFIL